MVYDGVEGQESKINGHKFGHRPQPVHGRAHGRAAYHHFGDRGVAHPPLAKLVIEAAGHGIGAAPNANLLAHDKHRIVSMHLFA